MTLRIGTRGSRLALAQAERVRSLLEAADPALSCELVVIRTMGDRVTDRPLASFSDSALFTREIERAILDGTVDFAVHSMKDLPARLPDGLVLSRALPREDPRDALVARPGIASLDDLPRGAVVATGSARRNVLLKHLRPDLEIVGIRGNVDTRLKRLFDPEPGVRRLDALVLAAAGLRRLGRADAITRSLDPQTMIPAPNQGTLAIELRADRPDLKARLDALGDAETDALAACERRFLVEIGADCHQPVAAFARREGERFVLSCAYARTERDAPVFADGTGSDPVAAAADAARRIRLRTAGTVTLVGAGPGDPDLVTVKGLAAIRSADCLVYDRLVARELVEAAPASCERIFVGKESGNHTLPQDEINALLVRKAMECRRVVRLKGGDPFVFGRGGEEILYLRRAGVPSSVIPGVTSAVAVPAAAGIPVTHRGLADGFLVVTAHPGAGRDDAPDYASFRNETRTLVFLMGRTRVGAIAAGLVAAGRAPDTPASVVSAGTTREQRTVRGTLADIAARADGADLPSPAVFVVGAVAGLDLKASASAGGRVLVAEIDGGGANRLVGALEARGAQVTRVTVGRIVSVGSPIRASDLSGITWLAFTSRNGLRACDAETVAAVRKRGIRVAAIGKATARAAEEKGFAVDWISPVSTGAGMSAAFAAMLSPSDGVLHPGADGAPDALSDLASVGRYRPYAAYRNEAVVPADPVDLSSFDAVCLTAVSSARTLLAHATGRTRLLAIGPATAAAIRAQGFGPVEVASSPTPEALADLAVRP